MLQEYINGTIEIEINTTDKNGEKIKETNHKISKEQDDWDMQNDIYPMGTPRPADKQDSELDPYIDGP